MEDTDTNAVSIDARLAIENSSLPEYQKQKTTEMFIDRFLEDNNTGTCLRYDLVAADIRRLDAKSAVPFLAGTIIAGLMFLPDNIKHAVDQIKANNLALDNFEVLCVLFARVDQLRNDFIEQVAEYAEQGVFPDGPGQPGWNAKEFDIAIDLLSLTLKD